jgi:hypothetical protein
MIYKCQKKHLDKDRDRKIIEDRKRIVVRKRIEI